MMRLGVMRDVVATVDGHGESPIANAIASAWDYDPGSVRFFRASANFVFRFTQAGQGYVLRFAHESERTVAAIEAELAFIKHLAAHGIAVAIPVPSRANRLVESVSTDLGVFHAAVFVALAGTQVEIEEISPEAASSWGRALGEFHRAAQGYSCTNRPTWRDHVGLIADQLPADEHAAHATLEAVQRRIAQLPAHPHAVGLIHFDFELDNIVWGADQVGVIDLDDCACYHFVADIAFALRDLFGDSATRFDSKNPMFQSFITGYRTGNTIDEEDLAHIPLFLRLHNLLLFARIQQALGSDEPCDEAEWVPALRKKLRAKMHYYRDEFAKPLWPIQDEMF